ncbi:MAG: hypothetical protein BIFFINMI_03202 [Phycisphaerae bacterium]|nr:hypothetical protein [Phycisphaerae bacterium]
MTRIVAMLTAGLAMLTLTATLPAQDASTFERQQRQYEERLRSQLDVHPSAEQRLGVDWGGWLNFAVSLAEDTGDELRTLRRYDLYLWGRATVDQGHEFYARGRLSFLDFNPGDAPDGNEDDWNGPNVDRLYYRYDYRSQMVRKEKRGVAHNFGWKIGRQYVQWGTGLALSLPMDAVQVWGELYNLEVTGLGGHTIASQPNFDRSMPVRSHNERSIYGVQVKYKGIPNHEPFAYYVWQQDHTRERPTDPAQEYGYDSQYLGFGSLGRLCMPGLYYQTELVFERGHSYGNGATDDPDRIRAMAYDVRVNYLIQDPVHQPELVFEYLFATGDSDRLGSPTNTVGGNLAGTTDRGFNGFGFRNTGMAYAPPMTNLHMFRLGANVRPLPNCKMFHDMVVGADAFFYLKDESRAAGADPASTRNSSNLGQETDVYMNWRITSDLLLTVRYGVFFPGSAYNGTRSARNFFFTGLSFSF